MLLVWVCNFGENLWFMHYKCHVQLQARPICRENSMANHHYWFAHFKSAHQSTVFTRGWRSVCKWVSQCV